MFNIRPTFTAPLALVAALCIGSAALAAPASLSNNASSANYGTFVAAQDAEKTIVITASTKYVNVDNGDTVRFVQGEQSFTFHFDLRTGEGVLKLSQIAPQPLMVGNIKVYVASNPLYRQ